MVNATICTYAIASGLSNSAILHSSSNQHVVTAFVFIYNVFKQIYLANS